MLLTADTWFAQLPGALRECVRSVGVCEEHPAGAEICKPGLPAHDLLLLEAGEVEIRKPHGHCLRAGEGEVVCEGEFFSDAASGDGVVALTPVRARRLRRRELMLALADQPADSLQLFLDALSAVRDGRKDGGAAGSSEEIVAGLAREAMRHRALRHPYLQALADGTLPDTRFAMRDFAEHYYGYSLHFPRYLTTVISRLEHPAHRQALLENLTEESGVYGEDELAELAEFGVQREWIEGVPHPVLFRRFSDAMGIDRQSWREADQVVCWREQFLALLAGGSAAEAVGALGLGTENIVSQMYGAFIGALGRLTDLSPRDSVFFPLHAAVDDHHQATLQAIAADLAATEQGRADLRRGMLKALQLRCGFWDWLHERAINPAGAAHVI